VSAPEAIAFQGSSLPRMPTKAQSNVENMAPQTAKLPVGGAVWVGCEKGGRREIRAGCTEGQAQTPARTANGGRPEFDSGDHLAKLESLDLREKREKQTAGMSVKSACA
jgi:hypothetical protein